MVGAEFLDKVLYYKKSWLPARELVEEAVKGRKEVTADGNKSKIKSRTEIGNNNLIIS